MPYAYGKYCLNLVFYAIFDWVWTCLVILSHGRRTFGVALLQPRFTRSHSEGSGAAVPCDSQIFVLFRKEC